MKDKWMNMGYEEDELKPFIEPIADFSDEKRIETLVIFTSKLSGDLNTQYPKSEFISISKSVFRYLNSRTIQSLNVLFPIQIICMAT